MAQFQLSEKEFVRASLSLSLRRPKRTLILLGIAIIMIALSQYFRSAPWIETVVYCVVAPTLFAGSFYLLLTRRLKKAFHEQRWFREPIELTIDEQQLKYSWPQGNAAFLWSDIRRWKETADFLFLFESDLYARILPKRALSEEEVAIIRAKTESLPRI